MDVLKQLEHAALPPRESLSDQVALILKKFILTEDIAAGDRLPPERQMADRLNISRTVLRESLNQLIGENILERSSPRILRVAPFDRAGLASSIDSLDTGEIQFRDLMELRYILEVGSIPLICEKITPTDIERIEDLAAKHRAEIDAGRSGIATDVQFHSGLVRIIDNNIVLGLIPIIEEQTRSYLLREPSMLNLNTSESQVTTRVTDEHQEIIDSLHQGDVAAGLAAMTKHLAPYFAKLKSPGGS